MVIDLCMWTKNGERTLKRALRRIDDVVPSEEVSEKILVDDHSIDRTVEIAKEFNWKVYVNPSSGISSGANEALRHVTTDIFASFEQDIFLGKDWFYSIYSHFVNSNVVVASGLRYDTVPGMEAWAKWRIERDKSEICVYGQSLDNTMYRRKFIEEIGGFPQLKVNVGFDVVLAYLVHQAQKQWVVDYNVESKHLRTGLTDVLKHQARNASAGYIVGRVVKKQTGYVRYSRFDAISKLWLSPLIGCYVAVKMKEARLMYLFPLIKFHWMKGLMKSGVFQT